MLKCGECQKLIPDDKKHRWLEDDVVVLWCEDCQLTFRITYTLADAEVSHDIDDALSDVYFG